MIGFYLRSALILAFLGAVIVQPGCSGGGGGSSSSSGGSESRGSIKLDGAFFGRGIDNGDGFEVVSPLSTVQQDPFTALTVPGTLKPLQEGVDLSRLISFGIGPDFQPLIIPRNGVLVVQFTGDVDPASAQADVILESTDPLEDETVGGIVDRAGTVQVRTQDGLGIEVELTVEGNRIIIDPTVGGANGFPASPIVFGNDGRAVADATGFLRVILTEGLLGTNGLPLVSREDGLGSAVTPLGFNPGNTALDFIERNDLLPGSVRFNGFLPDSKAPRIVREYKIEGNLDFAAGDTSGPDTITIAGSSFSAVAQSGRGEWADKLLVIRPGESNEERLAVDSNTTTRVMTTRAFANAPADGDAFQLIRAEFFEPAGGPIDPEVFDPSNPQNDVNRIFSNFVLFEEVDVLGNPFDANGDGKILYRSADGPVPSRSIALIRFNESMDLFSARPFESMRVTDTPEPPSAGFEYVGEVRPRMGGTVLAYVPRRADQFVEETSEIMGFGSRPTGARRLTLRSVPDDSFLEDRLSSREVAEFKRKGFEGLNDLGGQPLAFPVGAFDPETIFVEFSMTFTFETDVDQQYSDVGAVVHLFQGSPTTGTDPQSLEPGARFNDRDDSYYGPFLADVNLLASGVLSGAAVQSFRRTFDDQPGNRPPDGQISPFPFGTAVPIAGYNLSLAGGAPVYYAPIFGCRFQHIYRPQECSVSPTGDLSGTLMDLVRVSFAPIGGGVSPDIYENISIWAAHSGLVPDSTQSGGVPTGPFTGLGVVMDRGPYEDGSETCPASVQREPNHIGELENVVPAGTTFTISPLKLERIPGTPYPYHPWQPFKTPFQYNNTNTLLLEYRIFPQETPLSDANGVTFSPLILAAPTPRMRVYSYGLANNVITNPNPDPTDADMRPECASGRQPNPAKFGDNSRYFYSFDYVKTTSRIRSSILSATKLGEGADKKSVQWLPPIFEPPLSRIPPGTNVIFELRDAANPSELIGDPDSGWQTDVTLLGAGEYIQFRITVVGNPVTQLLPTFDSIAVPYYRIAP